MYQNITNPHHTRSHCTNCKLDAGKECTPDADAVCCSEQGIAATSSVKCTMSDGKQGYCNRGHCSTFTCNVNVAKIIRNKFCGVYSQNTCWAMCKGSDDKCIGINWGTTETIANGAFCETTSGERGTCGSGSCKALPKPDTPVNACLTNNGGCHSKRTCTAINNKGGRTCGDCTDGWVNDGEKGCKTAGSSGGNGDGESTRLLSFPKFLVVRPHIF